MNTMTPTHTVTPDFSSCRNRCGLPYTPRVSDEEWDKLEVSLQRHVPPDERTRIQRGVLRNHIKHHTP